MPKEILSDEDRALELCKGKKFEVVMREHDAWIRSKCNIEQLPRYAMLEQYGSPPLERFIAAAFAQVREECARVAESYPSGDEMKNWQVKSGSIAEWGGLIGREIARAIRQRKEGG